MASGVKIYKTTSQTETASTTTAKRVEIKNLNIQKPQANATTTPTALLLQMSIGKSLAGFSTGDVIIDSYIIASSLKYNVDPLLIYAQMNQESRFKQSAVSYKGASGLMQLMPDTARRFGVTNIFDKRQNIDAGVKYMRWLLNKFGGDVRLALAGYNAGEGAVMKYGNAIPPYRETQDYVKRITSHYSQIKNLNLNNTVAAISADQAPEIR
jgi:soluble lytic murein transglycosylase-like protein